MKMFLTRIGFGSKVVVTGDVTQVDVPDGKMRPRTASSGCSTASTAWRSCTSTGADVVRHRIVADIVAAYERDASDAGGDDRRSCRSRRPSRPSPDVGAAESHRRRRAGASVGRRRRADRRRRSTPTAGRRLAGAVLAAEGRARRAHADVRRRATRSPSSTPSTWAGTGPTDVLSFPLDDDAEPGDCRERWRPGAARRRRRLPGRRRRAGAHARRHARRRARPARRPRRAPRARPRPRRARRDRTRCGPRELDAPRRPPLARPGARRRSVRSRSRPA